MNVGRMRHRVQIQRRAAQSNDPAEDTWPEVATVWAFVQPIRGDERYNQQRVESTADIKVTMRHGVPLDARNNRLVYGARIFDVESVINIDERDRTLEVYCKERI